MLLLLGLLCLVAGLGSLAGIAYSMSAATPMAVFDASIGTHPLWCCSRSA